MKNKLIVIVGPTAVGKTALAIRIARFFNTEILSADSRQFFRELKIGTAAPSEGERSAATHHFVGFLSVKDKINASAFETAVIQFLDEFYTNNRCAILVGGSGLYIDAVCYGIDELPDPDPKLRERLKNKFKKDGLEPLREQLKILDPEYYNSVDLNNPNRLLRALEVCLTTGKPFSSLRKNEKKQRKFDIIKIGLTLPRAQLFERIHQRTDNMINSGLVKEVRGLKEFKNLNALNTVGYKEIFKYLEGEWTLEMAIEKIKTNTRRYAKRQLTWFQRDHEINWFSPDDTDQVIAHIQKYCDRSFPSSR